jgi:hypothetical protein
LIGLIWSDCLVLKMLLGGEAPMLRHHVKSTDTLKRLGTDNNGVVSLEYVIVTAFVITAVSGIAVSTLGGG